MVAFGKAFILLLCWLAIKHPGVWSSVSGIWRGYFFSFSLLKRTISIERCAFISFRRPSSLGVAPSRIKAFTFSGESDGSMANNLAAKLVTAGEDMDVPENLTRRPPGI